VPPHAIITCKRTMTGENPDTKAPQPGGRSAAPGALALVQAFMNTHFDLTAEGHGERLVSVTALKNWLTTHALLHGQRNLHGADLERTIAVREGLRALALANNRQDLNDRAVDAMRRASAGTRSEIHIEPDGPRLVIAANAGVDAAIGALLTITARAMINDTWGRLKACPGRDCGWAFYDHSRNQSARWCSMKLCGDREKARAYYQRKTAHQH
jgi:predicted RNA-binding Zn ribbon-like protein